MVFPSTLKENQVFVFGSNAQGFHGAGSAGYACRGVSTNTWRKDEWFLKAMRSSLGNPVRIGRWAILGYARGLQQGREGKSWAICTVERPGARRSIPLADIKAQLVQLWRYAKAHSHLEFLMTPIGCGYSGYTHEEMNSVLSEVILEEGLPTNILNTNGLYSDEPADRQT